MARLRQLSDPQNYRACDWNLKTDAAGRRYWVGHFCKHLELLATAISVEYPEADPAKIAAFRADYLAEMRALDAHPERFERIDVLYMDELRGELLRRFGFHDPFRGIKQRETERALTVLPNLLGELDATPPGDLAEKLALGLMAGNLFDLGAMEAMQHYRSNAACFFALRRSQAPRPWLIDHLAAWKHRWTADSPYAHAAFFVDNAGSDICLGCLPLVRWMLSFGTRVTLVANSGAALNDVTAPELEALLAKLTPTVPLLAEANADRRMSVLGCGCQAPLLDLTQLADHCAEVLADADLIILHGMGRAIESNFDATFSCDSLRLAVLKNRAVAERLGGRLFDCVFRFERGEQRP